MTEKPHTPTPWAEAKKSLREGVELLARAGMEEIPTAFHHLGTQLHKLEASQAELVAALRDAELALASLVRNEEIIKDALHSKGFDHSWMMGFAPKLARIRAALAQEQGK